MSSNQKAIEALKRIKDRAKQKPAFHVTVNGDYAMTPFTWQQVEGSREFILQDIDEALRSLSVEAEQGKELVGVDLEEEASPKLTEDLFRGIWDNAVDAFAIDHPTNDSCSHVIIEPDEFRDHLLDQLENNGFLTLKQPATP